MGRTFCNPQNVASCTKSRDIARPRGVTISSDAAALTVLIGGPVIFPARLPVATTVDIGASRDCPSPPSMRCWRIVTL